MGVSRPWPFFGNLSDYSTQEPDYFLHDEPLDSGRVDTPSILLNTIKKSNDDGGAEGFHEYFSEVSVDFESTNKLVNYLFFRPDEWRSNIEEIPPVLLNQDHFPKPLNQRLKALRDSYIFGNWIGVLALCRAVLEFALRDKAPTTKLANRQLDHLIQEINIGEDLRDQMSRIQERGNWILHPIASREVSEIPQQKSLAQKSMKDLILILEELYRAQ